MSRAAPLNFRAYAIQIVEDHGFVYTHIFISIRDTFFLLIYTISHNT